MNEMEIRKNERGFEYSEFTDYNGQKCSIQKSSIASDDAIWLGTFINRMHLNKEQVAAILPILHQFVKTGELSSDKIIKL
jgi:hypothetical protein